MIISTILRNGNDDLITISDRDVSMFEHKLEGWTYDCIGAAHGGLSIERTRQVIMRCARILCHHDFVDHPLRPFALRICAAETIKGKFR